MQPLPWHIFVSIVIPFQIIAHKVKLQITLILVKQTLFDEVKKQKQPQTLPGGECKVWGCRATLTTKIVIFSPSYR